MNIAYISKHEDGLLFDEIFKVVGTIKQCSDILAIQLQVFEDSKEINSNNKS
jgi:hypothetical protein